MATTDSTASDWNNLLASANSNWASDASDAVGDYQYAAVQAGFTSAQIQSGLDSISSQTDADAKYTDLSQNTYNDSARNSWAAIEDDASVTGYDPSFTPQQQQSVVATNASHVYNVELSGKNAFKYYQTQLGLSPSAVDSALALQNSSMNQDADSEASNNEYNAAPDLNSNHGYNPAYSGATDSQINSVFGSGSASASNGSSAPSSVGLYEDSAEYGSYTPVVDPFASSGSNTNSDSATPSSASDSNSAGSSSDSSGSNVYNSSNSSNSVSDSSTNPSDGADSSTSNNVQSANGNSNATAPASNSSNPTPDPGFTVNSGADNSNNLDNAPADNADDNSDDNTDDNSVDNNSDTSKTKQPTKSGHYNDRETIVKSAKTIFNPYKNDKPAGNSHAISGTDVAVGGAALGGAALAKHKAHKKHETKFHSNASNNKAVKQHKRAHNVATNIDEVTPAKHGHKHAKASDTLVTKQHLGKDVAPFKPAKQPKGSRVADKPRHKKVASSGANVDATTQPLSNVTKSTHNKKIATSGAITKPLSTSTKSNKKSKEVGLYANSITGEHKLDANGNAGYAFNLDAKVRADEHNASAGQHLVNDGNKKTQQISHKAFNKILAVNGKPGLSNAQLDQAIAQNQSLVNGRDNIAFNAQVSKTKQPHSLKVDTKSISKSKQPFNYNNERKQEKALQTSRKAAKTAGTMPASGTPNATTVTNLAAKPGKQPAAAKLSSTPAKANVQPKAKAAKPVKHSKKHGNSAELSL